MSNAEEDNVLIVICEHLILLLALIKFIAYHCVRKSLIPKPIIINDENALRFHRMQYHDIFKGRLVVSIALKC